LLLLMVMLLRVRYAPMLLLCHLSAVVLADEITKVFGGSGVDHLSFLGVGCVDVDSVWSGHHLEVEVECLSLFEWDGRRGTRGWSSVLLWLSYWRRAGF